MAQTVPTLGHYVSLSMGYKFQLLGVSCLLSLSTAWRTQPLLVASSHQPSLQAGCNFPEDKIVVAECEPGYLGRYLRHELELCHNNFQGDATELKNTIVHELVHAYDECRAKDFDWSNCRHLACSEVRSSAHPVAATCPVTPPLLHTSLLQPQCGLHRRACDV